MKRKEYRACIYGKGADMPLDSCNSNTAVGAERNIKRKYPEWRDCDIAIFYIHENGDSEKL